MSKVVFSKGDDGLRTKLVQHGEGIQLNEATQLQTTLNVAGETTFAGGYKGKRRVVDLDDTTAAPTAAQSGTVFTFDGSACTVTLPDTAAGLEYFFVVDTTQTGNAVITTQASDKLCGGFIKSTAAYNETNLSDTTSALDFSAGTANTLTMNGTTQGGVAGSYIHVIGLGNNKWSVNGAVVASGNLATSFS